MIRVLHVGKFFPPAAGGMERFLFDLTVEQRRQGIDARAIVHHHKHRRPTVSEVVAGVPVCRVQTLGDLLFAPVSPSFVLHLKRQIVQFEPDLLHFHLPNPASLLALASRTALKLPWIATWQSDITSETNQRLMLAYRFYRPLEQRFLAKCRFVLTSSPAYLKGSQALARWSSKCDAVPLGISSAQQRPSAEAVAWAQTQWKPGVLRVLCVGRLTYYKGHSFLLQALARITGVEALVVGGGNLMEGLKKQIARLGISDRARLTGYVEDEQVAALFEICDCLVLPSIERTEAFGLVLLEAMRRGKPVIATDIPHSGPAWIVRQGPSGLVVPPSDAAALADALVRFRDDPALRTELGTQGAAVFHDRFQIDRVVAAIRPFYDRACGQVQPAAEDSVTVGP